MAKDCYFQKEENMIHDQIVYHVFDRKRTKEHVKKYRVEAEGCMWHCDICRAAESSQNQLVEMRRQDAATPVTKVETKGQVQYAMNITDLDTLLRTALINNNASIVVAMATCQGSALVEIVMLEGEEDWVKKGVKDVEDMVVVVDTRWMRFEIVLTRKIMWRRSRH